MITSSSNPQIKNIIALNKRAKERKEQGLFAAEGWKMYREAPTSWIQKVYLSESFQKTHESLRDGIEYEIVDDRIFVSMCDTKTPQGILTLLRIPHYSPDEVLGGTCPFIMVLEDLQDPGNVGTILRTGEGAGVTGVVVTRNTADLFNPKTIRSTMGSIYRIPFLVTSNLPGFLPELKRCGIRTYAAHLKGKKSFREEDYTGPTAFLIGNEGNGLSDLAASQADHLIRIPMEGEVESLNAAIASAILMYEVQGQRNN